MGSSAQVHEVALPVGRRADVVTDIVVHDFELERVRCEHLTQRFVAVLLPLHCVVLPDEPLHALLDATHVLFANRIHMEVVVEAVLDGRPDSRLRLWVQLGDRLGQQVGAGVADDVEAGLGSPVNGLDAAIHLEHEGHVALLTID